MGMKVTLALPTEFLEVEQGTDKVGKTDVSDVFWAAPADKTAKSRPTLGIAVFTVEGVPPNAHMTEFADAFIASFPKKYTDYKKAPSSEVVINGRKFGTVTWEGHSAQTSEALHGFAYVAVLGSKCIAVEYREPTKARSYWSRAEGAIRSVKIQ